jgi:hypothetical protein
LSWQLLLQVPSGTQHVLLVVHTPEEHVHETWLPHPSEAWTLHWLPQLLVGEQQSVVPRSQTCPDWQPLVGHDNIPPQLSEMFALQRPAHVASVQHVLTPPLVVHSCPAAHPVVPLTPQFTVCMQLFVTEPHWLDPQACAVVSAVHPHAPFMQASPPAQLLQFTMLPQLSVDMPQRLSHQWGFGAQMHVPSWAHPSPGAHVPVQFQ